MGTEFAQDYGKPRITGLFLLSSRLANGDGQIFLLVGSLATWWRWELGRVFFPMPVVRSGVYVAPLGDEKSHCSKDVLFITPRKCRLDGLEC